MSFYVDIYAPFRQLEYLKKKYKLEKESMMDKEVSIDVGPGTPDGTTKSGALFEVKTMRYIDFPTNERLIACPMCNGFSLSKTTYGIFRDWIQCGECGIRVTPREK